jgi:hypothetical protein
MLVRLKFAFGDSIYELENYNLNMPVNVFLNNIRYKLKIDFEFDDSIIIQIIPLRSYWTNIPSELGEPMDSSNIALFTYLINNNSIDNLDRLVSDLTVNLYIRPIYMINNQSYQFTIRDNNQYYILNEELEQVKNGNLNINEIHFIPKRELVIEQPVIEQPVIEQPVIESDEYCSVCYSIDTGTVLSRYYNCRHEICHNCFSSWHNTSHYTCPLCRQCEL